MGVEDGTSRTARVACLTWRAIALRVYINVCVEGVSPFPCYERPVLPAPTLKPTPVSVLARSVYRPLVNISLRSASQLGYSERERERERFTPPRSEANTRHLLELIIGSSWQPDGDALSLSVSLSFAHLCQPPHLCHLHHQHKGEPAGGGRRADRITGWYMSFWQSITRFREGWSMRARVILASGERLCNLTVYTWCTSWMAWRYLKDDF